MGKKRSHQVTRSILKSFPTEADKVLKEEIVSDQSDAEVNNSASEADDAVDSGLSGDDDDGEEEFDEDELAAVDSDGADDGFSEEEGEEEDVDVKDDSDSIEDLKRKKKVKKTIVETDLSSAIANILGEKTKGDQPILARRKGIERKIEDAKLEAKARSHLRKQRLATKDSARQLVPSMSRANYERQLKKAGTKGVVQLFNAIHQHQVMKEKLAKEKAAEGSGRKAEVAAQLKRISKTSFLDMLKGGSTAQLKK